MSANYGLDPKQFVRHIIRPTLQRIELWSEAAEVLVLGTALVESHLRYVDQIDRRNRPGPAFGLWQMEGPTHHDHWEHFLRYGGNTDLRWKLIRLATHFSGDHPDPGEMVFNMAYACAMCRVDYRRVKSALPPTNNAAAMADYHKAHYNSRKGKTKVEESIKHFEFAIALEV